MITFKKGSEDSFFPGLMVKDFQCKCTNEDCTIVNMSDKLFNALVKLKVELKLKKIVCLSGNRCEKHNLKVEGVPNSRHLVSVGEAIDMPEVMFPDPEEAVKILYRVGFTFIKYYPNKKFFHADVREQH